MSERLSASPPRGIALPRDVAIGNAPVILQSENVSSSPTALTPPAGADFLMVFSVGGGTGGDSVADAVTWDGVPLTELPAARANGSGWECCGAWYLANPTMGTLNIAYSGETGNHRLLIYWLQGVDVDDPIRDVGVTNFIDVPFIDVTGVASTSIDLTLSGLGLSHTAGSIAGLGLIKDQEFRSGGGTLAGGYELGVKGDASIRWYGVVGGRFAGNLVSIKGL